jgi:hypothetical protein
VKTEAVGGSGGAEFEDVPEGNKFVVGFRLTRGGGSLKSLRMLYWTGDRIAEGRQHAPPDGDVTEVVAKGGYAVGGIRVRGGQGRVRAFRVVFMKASGALLDRQDAYESDWYVGDATDTVLYGGDGFPVVGVHGRAGNDIDAFGLILFRP